MNPLLLEGGLDWKALSLSPKDMDFTEAKAGAAREIALAFGVPPLLLGLPGDNSFRNYEEANRAFWRQTVIPMVARLQKSFHASLQPAYAAFLFDYNIDRIDALARERQLEWSRIRAASFLTQDEQLEAVGYGPAPKPAPGPTELRYSPNQPRVPAGSAQGGQWTSGGGGGGGGGGDAGLSGAVSLLDAAAGAADALGAAAQQVALNVDPGVASDAGSLIEPAQFNRLIARFGNATPTQTSRLLYAIERANTLEARVKDIVPNWRPEPTVLDPENIEGQISLYEAIGRQAAERLQDHFRDTYGSEIAPPIVRLPDTTLTGPKARIRAGDAREVRRGAQRENDSAVILWLNGHNVEQKPLVDGPKDPDYRIDGEIFDNYAPETGNLRAVWTKVEQKVAKRQAENIVLNLRDSTLTQTDVIRFFFRNPVPGLTRLWIIDRDTKVIRAIDPYPF